MSDIVIINHAHDENEACNKGCRTPSGESVSTMTKSTTEILDDDAIALLEAACEALKGVKDACDITQAKPEFVNYVLKCNPANVSALCQTVRALKAENERLKEELDDAYIQDCPACGAGAT